MKWDVFISHAGEDKETIARPLCKMLQDKGLDVWFDSINLTLGDDLRQGIDDGLANSQFGVVILSKSYFDKSWPRKELEGLVALEDGNRKVILPIWHEITREEVIAYSPILGGKLAINSSVGFKTIVDAILNSIGKASAKKAPEEIKNRNARILEVLRKESNGYFIESWMNSKIYKRALACCNIKDSEQVLGAMDIRGFFILPIRKYIVFGENAIFCYSERKIKTVNYSDFQTNEFYTISHSGDTGRQTVKWEEVKFGNVTLFDTGDDFRVAALMAMLTAMKKVLIANVS